MDLSRSPLAETLRVAVGGVKPRVTEDGANAVWAALQACERMGLTTEPEADLCGITPIGRATLAALSLPDPGEPEIEDRSDAPGWLVRSAVWKCPVGQEYEWAVCVTKWRNGGVVTTNASSGGVDGEVALWFASAIIAASALAEQWRAEKGGA